MLIFERVTGASAGSSGGSAGHRGPGPLPVQARPQPPAPAAASLPCLKTQCSIFPGKAEEGSPKHCRVCVSPPAPNRVTADNPVIANGSSLLAAKVTRKPSPRRLPLLPSQDRVKTPSKVRGTLTVALPAPASSQHNSSRGSLIIIIFFCVVFFLFFFFPPLL